MMICGGNPVFLFIEIVRALKNAENNTFEKWTIFLSGKKTNLNLFHCNTSVLKVNLFL